jgi:hypothetical protein
LKWTAFEFDSGTLFAQFSGVQVGFEDAKANKA